MKYTQVLGVGLLAIVGFIAWMTFRKKEQIIDPYADTKYVGMTEAEAWAYYQQLMRAAAEAEMEAYLEDPEKAEKEHLEELGITEEELPTYQEFALQVNLDLGGSYVAGYLTPPASWTGSVTEWSRYVQQVTNVRWHQMYG